MGTRSAGRGCVVSTCPSIVQTAAPGDVLVRLQGRISKILRSAWLFPYREDQGYNSMVAVPCWTGAETKALRQAMRLSIRAFAAHLGIDARTVNKWEARGGTITLRPSTQSFMDTALNRAPEEVKARFTQTAGSAKQEQRGDTVQLAAPGHGFGTEPAPDTDSLVLSPGDDGADSLFTELARHLLAHAAATSTGTTGPFPDQETHARQLADYLRTWATDVNRRKLLRLLLGIGGGYSFAMGTAAAAAATPAGLDRFDVDPVEHFQRMKNLLMDHDNIFGANSVILSTQEQIDNLQQLRQSCRGADREKLLHIQTQFADLCGWLYQDSGDYHAATYWSGRALEWAHMRDDQDAIAFILARRSQLAGDMGDPTEAIDAAEAALNTAPHDASRVVAVAMTYAAHAHALGGNKVSCERSYAMAHEVAARLEADHASPWALFFNHSYVEVQRGRSLIVLGEYDSAVESFRKAVSGLPHGYRRDCGVYLAREAAAHMGQGDVEQASAVGLQALAIGAETRSARIIGELKRLDAALRKFSSSANVANFHEAMRATFSPLELMGVPQPRGKRIR